MPIPAHLPANEAARLARLRALAILDTAPEPIFDRLTQMASRLCDAPIALVSLIDSDRQWFKSRAGLDATQTHRDLAFCAHAIHEDALMEVPDTWLDHRFADNDLVTGEPNIRFYAGAPLITPEGFKLGTLCVIDRQPRQLSSTQKQQLMQLAECVSEALLLREKAMVAALRSNEHILQEQALRANSLGHVLDELPEIIGVWGMDGRNQYANATHQAWFGKPTLEMHGTSLEAVFPPQASQQLIEHLPEVMSGVRHTFRTHIGPWTGHGQRLVAIDMLPLQQPGELTDCFVLIGRDITAEHTLKRSEQFLDRKARMAQVGGWELDLIGDKLTWSDQTYRIHDLPLGQPVNVEFAVGFYEPESRKTVQAAVSHAIASGQGWDLELSLLTATGRSVWVRTHGEVDVVGDQPVRLFGTIQDVTERRVVQMALEKHRHQLQVTYTATPAMLQSMDAQGNVRNVTDLWLQTLQFERLEVIHHPSSNFIHADSRQRYLEEVLPELFKRGSVRRVPLRMVGKHGQIREVLFSAVVHDNLDEPGQLAMACIDDITEDLARKALLARERELRQELGQRAVELERLLGERSDMLEVMVHEIRQPLNNAAAALRVVGTAISALNAGGSTQPAETKLDRAQDVMSHIQASIDNTLAAASLLSGSSPLERLDTDIDTLIRVAIGDLASTQQSRIVIDRVSHTRTISMEMNLMRLALRNLLANALRYSPPGTTVVLRITDSDQPLALALEVSNACNGGINPALASRVFERGAKGNHPQSGQGMGLYIVKRVMELHHGFALLTRNDDEGCSFQLLITPNNG